ncbi:conserved hypothetical protein [Gammaproteobacteria bacterium]
MNLLRFLFFLAVGWLGWILLRRWLCGQRFSSIDSQPSQTPTMRMVRCTYCGIHLPQRDALKKNHHWYCDRAHLEADLSNQHID